MTASLRHAALLGVVLAVLCLIAPTASAQIEDGQREIAPGVLAPVKPEQAEAAAKALPRWAGAYAKGQLDLTKPRINKTSAGVRVGLVSDLQARSIGHLQELKIICASLRDHQDPDVAEGLLELAAVAMAGRKIDSPQFQPAAVLLVAEKALDTLTATAALEVLQEAATDERGKEEIRAAALRALGRREDELFRPAIEAAFAADAKLVRLAAVDATGFARLRTLLEPLAKMLQDEPDDVVAAAGLGAAFVIIEKFRDQLPQDSLRRVADAAIGLTERGAWQSALAAVEILKVIRSAQAVPALIAVLERHAEAETDDDRLLSGLLREEAHDTLKSLTGAGFPAADAAGWRKWWDGVKGTFTVVEIKDQDASVDPERTQTENAFFGIPVRGTRVLFIVDGSGSMAAPFHAKRPAEVAPGIEVKIDAARVELNRAVQNLTADCYFNVIVFGNKAEGWQRDMVPADAKWKKKFERFAEKLRADGGTNLWQGLVDGLQWRSMIYGERYGATFDEVFVLSDGLPSLGDVQDPRQILPLVQETNRYSKLRINTIYIAGPPELEKRAAEMVGMSGADFMRQLAEQNNGRHIAF